MLIPPPHRNIPSFNHVYCMFSFSILEDTALDVPELRLGSKTDSMETCAFLAQQIERCQGEHGLCRALSNSWYPTRLLEIPPLGNALAFRLIETAEQDLQTSAPATYAILSHCWGGKLPLRLLSHNQHTYKTSIAVISTPRLYLDAAKVVFDLGLRYIWKDSLCIIQDSVQDWRQESALMGQIYQNSVFNIEAVSANDCSVSLFASRDAFLLLPNEISVPLKGKDVRLVWIQRDDLY
ncbi:heterokaryon incompatibility protein-domain-containing protein [Hypoxylon sp. NC1633]|nr:heterokaryon incompatibility protein-domain-containing protein [Hypoxylon sp. NC1633]